MPASAAPSRAGVSADVERGGGRYGVFVFGWRRGSMSHEDPSVAAVEAILGADALTVQPRPRSAVRPIASHALWICACVTVDDAPTWLIYDTEDGVSWCRVADKMEPLDLVNARLTAGGHADPAQVLLWLEARSRRLGATVALVGVRQPCWRNSSSRFAIGNWTALRQAIRSCRKLQE